MGFSKLPWHLEVADLDENRGAFGFGEGSVVTHVRAADPSASGIGAVLIAEDACEDEDLLPTNVGMRIEPGVGRPTHESGMLGEAFMERGDLKPRHHALPPIHPVASQGKGAFFGLGPIATVLVKDTARLGLKVEGLAREKSDVGLRPEAVFANQEGALEHQELAKLLARVHPDFPSRMSHDRNLRPVTLPLAFQRHRPLPLQDGSGVHHNAFRMVGM